MSTPFYVVFDGMPGPHPYDCSFVETESEDGLHDHVAAGEWSDHPRDRNLARLGPFVKATPLTLAAPALLEALLEARGALGDIWEAIGEMPSDPAEIWPEALESYDKAGALANAAIAQAEGK